MKTIFSYKETLTSRRAECSLLSGLIVKQDVCQTQQARRAMLGCATVGRHATWLVTTFELMTSIISYQAEVRRQVSCVMFQLSAPVTANLSLVANVISSRKERLDAHSTFPSALPVS